MSVNMSIAGNWDRAKHRLINGLIILALLVEVYFLIYDIPVFTHPFNSYSNQDRAPIAELVQKTNTVNVQNFESLIWEHVDPGQILYRKQSLLTLTDSKAEIAFLDGTGIVMDENSLIELEKSPADGSEYKKIVIRLLRGSLSKTKGKKRSEILRKYDEVTPTVIVETDQMSVVLTPDSETTISKGITSSIELQSGKLEIETPKGNFELKPGSLAVVKNANEAPVILENKISYLFPNMETGILPTQNQTFRWSSKDAKDSQTIQIASDPSFKNIVTEVQSSPTLNQNVFESSVNSEQLKQIKKSGHYFWRIKGFDEYQKFYFHVPSADALIFPPNDAQITTSEADLVWKAIPNQKEYNLELELPDGTSQTFKTKTPNYHLKDLKPGKYRWRVSQSDFRNFEVKGEEAIPPVQAAPAPSAPTSPVPLEKPLTPEPVIKSAPAAKEKAVKPAKEKLPPPPTLQNPEFNMKPGKKKQKADQQSWLDFLLPSAHAEETATALGDYYEITLKWQPVPEVFGYKVQIGKTKNFKDLLFNEDTQKAEIIWDYQVGMENSKGRVFFRVASVSKSGKTGKFSEPMPIEIPKLILNPVIAKKLDPKEVEEKKEKKKAAEAAAAAASTANAEPEEKVKTDFHVRLDTGLGNLKQNSTETNLSSVSITAPFLQQKLSFGYTIGEWALDVSAGIAKFRRPDTLPSTLQPDVVGFDADLNVLRWANFSDSEWIFGYGVTIQRGFRWVKVDLQSVEPQGAFSFGPQAFAMRNYKEWSLGFSAKAPFTGLFLTGSAGIRGSAFGEWKLFKFEKNTIGIQLTAEASFLMWKSPSSTTLMNWAIWLGPIFHFSNSPG
jgi:hypothetical protein